MLVQLAQTFIDGSFILKSIRSSHAVNVFAVNPDVANKLHDYFALLLGLVLSLLHCQKM